MIYVISGTQDGRALIQDLVNAGYAVIASATTEYGADLIKEATGVEVLCGKLNSDDMSELIDKRAVEVIVDASHPYASNVSENAIEASKNAKIRYIRFEREESDLATDNVTYLETYEQVIDALEDTGENILLTVGSNNLERFKSFIDKGNIFARVLPTSNVIGKCEALGLKPKNIIAMQGPFSTSFNIEMIKQFNIKWMVTKESSDIGGFNDKVEAAKQSGVHVLVLKRPKIEYPEVYDNNGELIAHL